MSPHANELCPAVSERALSGKDIFRVHHHVSSSRSPYFLRLELDTEAFRYLDFKSEKSLVSRGVKRERNQGTVMNRDVRFLSPSLKILRREAVFREVQV